MTSAWYVAQVHPQAERTAEWNLKNQGIETRLFSRTEDVIVRGERRSRQVLMLPGYIFLTMDVERQRWQAVNYTRGIRHLLPVVRERPVPLASDAMAWLAAQELEFGRIIVGRLLRILAGPYKGLEVVTRSVDEKKQVLETLVTMFGQELVVSLKFHAVRALDSFGPEHG